MTNYELPDYYGDSINTTSQVATPKVSNQYPRSTRKNTDSQPNYTLRRMFTGAAIGGLALLVEHVVVPKIAEFVVQGKYDNLSPTETTVTVIGTGESIENLAINKCGPENRWTEYRDAIAELNNINPNKVHDGPIFVPVDC